MKPALPRVNPGSLTRRAVIRHRNATGRWTTRRDALAVEEPLEIRVRGRSIAVTMRTPGHDEELAAGFLLTERVISERNHLKAITPCRASATPANTVNVFLTAGVEVDFARLTRHFLATSSCGVCGRASVEAVRGRFPAITSNITVAPKILVTLPARMRRAQRAFDKTGGLHAAAIFNSRGRLIVAHEDVGRHNAVDKVIGHGFLRGHLPYDAHILLVSGRASFEITQKALAAGIPIVGAVSAPSSLAVKFAEDNGQTLVGFLRGTSMNIYAHRERIAD